MGRFDLFGADVGEEVDFFRPRRRGVVVEGASSVVEHLGGGNL